MQDLGHYLSEYVIDQCNEMDIVQQKKRERMLKSPTKKRRKELKRQNIKKVEAFKYMEGTQYQSGAFTGGQPAKKKKIPERKTDKGAPKKTRKRKKTS